MLASKQMEYAKSEDNLNTLHEWRRHRNFEKGRPMVHLELWTFEREVIDHRLKCETDIGRQIERTLYQNFINHTLFKDDKPVQDYYPIGWRTFFNLFGLKIEVEKADSEDGNYAGHQFKHVINNLKDDYDKLKLSTYGVDREATLKYKSLIDDIIGDILPTKLVMRGLSATLTQSIVHIMGMQTMFMSMYDFPELFINMMDRAAKDYISYFKWLESEKLLLPTTSTEHLGQGTWCFTNELPNEQPLTTKDVWGFMDSQETVGISQDMFDTFIFPSYKKISEMFGLLSYGCCEPVSSFWEKSLSKLSNLRNISISPWCDEEYMADKLRNKKIIYHRKPSSNYLGVPKVLDEAVLREHIRKTLEVAKGCQLEFTQRDIYTIHNNESKARRFVEVIREEIDSHWK